jgi:hypothetical protein
MLKYRIDHAIGEMMKSPDREELARLRREFMLFTNDLDKSRRQNIHEALPELSQFMDEAVGGWTAELLNA